MQIPVYWSLPFAALLLGIAILPLLVPHFWEKNRNKALLSLGLAVPVVIYLVQVNPNLLLHAGHEYVSFLALLASLYIISGGLFISGNFQGTPKTNLGFLALGAVLASIIGTTGASMLLIRPMIRANSQRKFVAHIPIFFILIVSNAGGLLTPIGDPPLFLGFLKGVPFFWTLHFIKEWALVVGTLLVVFYFWDKKSFQKEAVVQKKLPLSFDLEGLVNIPLLALVVGSVFLPSPYRELGMILISLFSLFLTTKNTRVKNSFTFHPIVEVAILFAGIFVTMVPALEFLREQAPSLGISKPWHFFWLTGGLSSFLDNAPTYLTFFSLAQGLHFSGHTIAGVPASLLEAISCGAVLMGANSYIGNGPNFMVKAIADEAGLPTPSFFAYMGYALVLLMPLYLIITFFFL